MQAASTIANVSLDDEALASGPVWLPWVLPVAAVLSLLMIVAAVLIARHWPFVNDAPIVRYNTFLMSRGWAPYRDIVDFQMPSTYIADYFVVHTLGSGATAWWLWDTLSGVAALAGGAWIAGRGKRAVGLVAVAPAYLSHLSGGAGDLGQRDWIVGVFLLLAVGGLFTSIRRAQPAWMALFAALAVFAGLSKPPMLGLAVLFTAAVCWMEYRRGRTWLPFAGWALAGALVPLGGAAAFLLRWHVVHEFWWMLHVFIPWYVNIRRLGLAQLIPSVFPEALFPLFLGAPLLFLADRSWSRWENNFLAAAALGGLFSAVSQGKGWLYHQGPWHLFLGLWCLLEIYRALAYRSWRRPLALAVLCGIVFVTCTRQFQRIRESRYYWYATQVNLEADLHRLHAQDLNGQVQCMDMTRGGCINALYNMGLVQSTGYIADFMLFAPERMASPVTVGLQDRFLREMNARPPRLIIVTTDDWIVATKSNYSRLDRWPAFRDWLTANYTVEHELPFTGIAGYRIYVHR